MASLATKQLHRQQRGNIFYFRVAVPLELQEKLGREYKCSLGTRDYKLSAYLCRYLSCKAEDFFVKIKKKIPTEYDLRNFMREYFEKQLEQAMFDYQSARSMFFGGEPETPSNDPYGFIKGSEAAFEAAKNNAATYGYTEEQEQEAEKILKKSSFETFPYAGTLAQYMMNALIEARRIELAYHQNGFADVVIKHPQLLGARNVFEQSDQSKVTLRQCVEHYISSKEGTVEPKTLHSIKAFMNRLCDILGENRDMQSITKQPDGVFLERTLPKIPANFVRDYQNKGKELMKVIESGQNYEKITAKTASTYWMYFKEFFSWAEEREYISRNPLSNIKIKVTSKKDGRRPQLSNEQLQTLFSSPIYTGRKHKDRKLWEAGKLKIRDGNFWMPLIGLYTGMREGEILQLTKADVKQENGILYFDINRNNSKTLKTERSIRKVPIHPELIKMGLPDYLESRAKQIKNDGRIFEDGIKIPKNLEITKNYSRGFSEYTVQIGMRSAKDGQEVFHSLRHNLQTALSKAGVLNTVSCKILGHEPPKEMLTTGDTTYNHHNPSLDDLYRAISKAKYDVDLSHLYVTKD